MGYYSKVRGILLKEDYEELVKRVAIEFSNYSHLFAEDYFEIFVEKKGWVYFGWEDIKWYATPFEYFVEDFVRNSPKNGWLRLGEENTDIDEWENNLEDCPFSLTYEITIKVNDKENIQGEIK
jgi:hypothetical protein